MRVEQEKQEVAPLPLIGTEEATMDEKGRVLIGTKLRKRLGPNFAMTLGDNGAISAYPEREWTILVQDLLSRDPRDEARQNYARRFFGNAADELDFDQQGRVVIPKKLRDLSGIEDKVIIVGAGDHVEIWHKPVYDHIQRTAPNQKDSLTAMRDTSLFKPGQARYAIRSAPEEESAGAARS